MYTDKTITCRECGAEFAFTGSEQAFYAEKGFQNEPGRCPACRANRRQNTRGGNTGDRQMFDVIDRPVYCRDCFARHSTR
jgi:hypothetical protein